MPRPLPDAGEAFRLWAMSRPAITDLVGQRVSIRLTSQEPAVRYALSGGATSFGEGTPVLQVEAWGRGGNALDDGAASRIARTIASEVEGTAMRGTWGDAWVAGAFPEVYPYDSPDTQTERPRQIFTVRMFVYSMEEA